MIQGIWMWPNNVYEYGAEKIISVLKKAGFTDIYFLTKGLSGKTSFHGQHAPHAFDRDVLREVIDFAHRYGIRVHAWFTSASDEYYKDLHPDSGRAHFKRGKDKGLVSFKDQDYLVYLKKIVDEVIQSYEIDGIHLDYIRYNHILYGWDEKDISAYEAFGADRKELFDRIEKEFFSEKKSESVFEAYKGGNRTLKAFAESRKSDVLRFASFVLNGVKDLNPNLILSAAVMPEGAYADSAFADLHYGQDYTSLSPLFDYLIPMSYSKAYEKTSEWLTYIGENLTAKNIPYLLGIQAYDHASGSAIHSDVLCAKKTTANGIVLFREGECAVVYRDHGLHLFNDTDETITKIELKTNVETQFLTAEIRPGEIYDMNVSAPDSILLYSEEKNVCVFYDKNRLDEGVHL